MSVIEPIEGAHQALQALRELSGGVRLLTNTTSRSRRAVYEHLLELRFDVSLRGGAHPGRDGRAPLPRTRLPRGRRARQRGAARGSRRAREQRAGGAPAGDRCRRSRRWLHAERPQRSLPGTDGRSRARRAATQPLLAPRRRLGARCGRLRRRARVRQRDRGGDGRQAGARLLRGRVGGHRARSAAS